MTQFPGEPPSNSNLWRHLWMSPCDSLFTFWPPTWQCAGSRPASSPGRGRWWSRRRGWRCPPTSCPQILRRRASHRPLKQNRQDTRYTRFCLFTVQICTVKPVYNDYPCLGTQKWWLLFTSGRCLRVVCVIQVQNGTSKWCPLLAGGRYSLVVVSSG